MHSKILIHIKIFLIVNKKYNYLFFEFVINIRNEMYCDFNVN